MAAASAKLSGVGNRTTVIGLEAVEGDGARLEEVGNGSVERGVQHAEDVAGRAATGRKALEVGAGDSDDGEPAGDDSSVDASSATATPSSAAAMVASLAPLASTSDTSVSSDTLPPSPHAATASAVVDAVWLVGVSDRPSALGAAAPAGVTGDELADRPHASVVPLLVLLLQPPAGTHDPDACPAPPSSPPHQRASRRFTSAHAVVAAVVGGGGMRQHSMSCKRPRPLPAPPMNVRGCHLLTFNHGGKHRRVITHHHVVRQQGIAVTLCLPLFGRPLARRVAPKHVGDAVSGHPCSIRGVHGEVR